MNEINLLGIELFLRDQIAQNGAPLESVPMNLLGLLENLMPYNCHNGIAIM